MNNTVHFFCFIPQASESNMSFNVSKMVKIKNDRSEITDGSSSFSMTVDVIITSLLFSKVITSNVDY